MEALTITLLNKPCGNYNMTHFFFFGVKRLIFSIDDISNFVENRRKASIAQCVVSQQTKKILYTSFHFSTSFTKTRFCSGHCFALSDCYFKIETIAFCRPRLLANPTVPRKLLSLCKKFLFRSSGKSTFVRRRLFPYPTPRIINS